MHFQALKALLDYYGLYLTPLMTTNFNKWIAIGLHVEK